MAVADYCTRDVVTARPDESVREVAKRMDRLDVGCVVIVDATRRPAGLVTDRDIVLRALRRGLDLDATPIRDLVVEEIVSIGESSPLSRALRCMRRDGLRRIPLVDSEGALSGIIALDDALQVIASEISAAAAVAKTQIPQPSAG